jgi:hypothetical protein
MELGVGEQRVARGGGRQRRKVEHRPRRMQGVRAEPQDIRLERSHAEEKQLRREGRR